MIGTVSINPFNGVKFSTFLQRIFTKKHTDLCEPFSSINNFAKHQFQQQEKLQKTTNRTPVDRKSMPWEHKIQLNPKHFMKIEKLLSFP